MTAGYPHKDSLHRASFARTNTVKQNQRVYTIQKQERQELFTMTHPVHDSYSPMNTSTIKTM